MATDPQMATITDLVKKAQNSLFGKYRAVVKDNKDPERRGRLKLIVPSVFRDQMTDWVPGVFALGGHPQEAALFIPAQDSHVLVEFIEGDRSAPVWTGAYHPRQGAAAAPNAAFDLEQGMLHLLRTRSGVTIRLEDDGEAHQVLVLSHPGGAEIRIDKEGIMTLRVSDDIGVILDPKGNVARLDGPGDSALVMENDKTTLSHGATRLELSATGAKIVGGVISIDGDSVTLGKNATSPILNAQAFSTFFDAHLHAPGSPPAPPSAAALAGLSLLKVKGA